MKPCPRCGKATDWPFHTCLAEVKTPRCDEQLKKQAEDAFYSSFTLSGVDAIDVQFARQLEQELQHLREQFAKEVILFKERTTELQQAQQASAEYIARTDPIISCGCYHDEMMSKCGHCRACLKDELQQAREELAATRLSDDRAHLAMRKAHHQLSQWQECAREQNRVLLECQKTYEFSDRMFPNTFGNEISQISMALSLFTQLTSTTTGEKE